jgi:hypothetical protein
MDERLNPVRTIASIVGIAVAMALIYVRLLPGTFQGPLWPPSQWGTTDFYRLLILLFLALCGVLLYSITLPLEGDALERAQHRVGRTKRIVLLLTIAVLGFISWAAFVAPYLRVGLYN